MKKRLTKPLSVLLAIVMLFTSINIMMPVVADAAASAAQITNLNNVIAQAKAAGVFNNPSASWSVNANGVDKKGDDLLIVNDLTAGGWIYKIHQAMIPVSMGELVSSGESKDSGRIADGRYFRRLGWVVQDKIADKSTNVQLLIANLHGGKTVAMNNGQTWVSDRDYRSHHDRTNASSITQIDYTTIRVDRSREGAVLSTYPTFASLPSVPTVLSMSVSWAADTTRKQSSNSFPRGRYRWYMFSGGMRNDGEYNLQEVTPLTAALRGKFSQHFTPELLAIDPYDQDWDYLEELVVDNAAAMAQTNEIRAALTHQSNYNAVMNQYFNMADINNFVNACSDAMLRRRAEAYTDLYYDMNNGTFDLTVNWDDVASVMALRETINQTEALISEFSDPEVQAFIGGIYPYFNLSEVRAFQQAFDYDYERTLLQWVKDGADAYLAAHYTGLDTDDPEYYTNIDPNPDYNHDEDENHPDNLGIDPLIHTRFDIMYGSFKAYKDILSRSYVPANFNAVFGNANGAEYILDFLALLDADYLERSFTIFHADYYQYFLNLFAEDLSKLKAERVMEKHLEEAQGKMDEYFVKYNEAITKYGQAGADKLFPGIHALSAQYTQHKENVKYALGARLKAQVEVTMALVPADRVLTWHNFNQIQSAVKNLEHVIYDTYSSTGYIENKTKTDYLWLRSNVLDLVAEFTANNGFDRFVQTKYDSELPTRKPKADDFVRSDSPTDDYVVTNAKLGGLVEKLEKIILSEDIADILDLDESFGERLSDIVAKNIYKDSFVNTIVDLFYPMIYDELNGFMDELPTKIEAAGSHTIRYDKGLREISNDLGLLIYPDTMGTKVDVNKFPVAWTQLRSTQNWDDLYDEDGDLVLFWGLDDIEDMNERAEMTKEALASVLGGLLPIFLALLCNRTHSASSKDVAYVNFIGKIWGSLEAKVTANEGLAKTFVPIFELLNIPAAQIPSRAQINAVTTARGLVDVLFGPLIYFMDNQLAVTPLQTLVDVLPNLAYALSMEMVAPTLSGLSTSLEYNIKIRVAGINVNVKDDKIAFDVGEMLDLDDLGIDLSGFDGLINMLLEDDDDDAEPIELPFLNSGTMATLGQLKTVSSKRPSGTRYTVEANRGDIMYFLFNYLLDAIGDEAFVNTLLGLLGDDEDDDDEGLSPEILEILAGLGDEASRGDIIAAIVELFYPQEYDMLDYTWSMPEAGYNMAYLGYHNNWTKKKADYFGDNIDNLVNAVGEMLELEEDIPAMLTGMLDEVFTAETLKSLTDTLADLDLDDEIMMLLDGILGVDLSAWSIYDETYEPVVENRDDFFDQLYEILTPLAPLFGFLLTGENISAFDGNLNILGYEGYANGLIPLLEALGCDGILTPAQYKAAIAANESAAISGILDPIIGLIDRIAENPISTILDILPGVLYFLESGGLAVSVQNLLHSLLVLIDTIRPIYNINLETIIDLVAGDDDEDEDEDEDEEPGILENLLANIQWIDDLTLNLVFDLIEGETGLHLNDILGNAIERMSRLSEPFASKNGKTAYTVNLDRGDTITVLISALIELLNDEQNQDVLTEMLELDEGILPAVISVINGTAAEVEQIKWLYFDGENADYENALAYPETVVFPPHTIEYLRYGNNWTVDKAEYLDANFENIINMILRLVDEENGTIADMLDGVLDIYNDDIINSLFETIQSLVSELDETLLELIDVALDLDVSAWAAYGEDYEWGVTDKESFIAALAEVLAPIERLLDWVLCADDIAYFHTSTGDDLIYIPGTEGYAYGLVPLLEALGVTGLLNKDEFKAASFEDKIDGLLNPVLTHVENILADPVDMILALIPNLLYFMNADGLTVVVNNLLGGVFNILEDIEPILDEPIDLDEMIGFPISDISLSNLLDLAEEAIGLNIGNIRTLLEGFYLGEISHFTSASGDIAFRMDYSEEEGRKDFITILISLVVELLYTEENRTALAEMLDVDEDILHTVVKVISGSVIEIQPINWFYFDETIKYDEAIMFPDDVVFPARTIEYLGYLNDWDEEKAAYLDENLSDIIDMILVLLDEENGTVADMLDGVLDIYNDDIVNSLISAVQDLTSSLDADLLQLIDVVLDLDISAWNTYAEDHPWGVTDKDSFIAALAEALAPIERLFNWLFCADDIAYFHGADGDDLITVTGTDGYAYGLVPLLEALGVQGLMNVDAFKAATFEEKIKGLLGPVLTHVENILADPVDGLLALIPNLIYFLNADGLTVSIENLLGGVYNIIDQIEPIIGEIDLDEEIGFPLSDLSLGSLLAIAVEETGLDLTKIINLLDGFYLGEIEYYISANKDIAFRMVYSDKENRKDLITIVFSLLIELIYSEQNREVLADMLDLDANILPAVIKIISGSTVNVLPIDWFYFDDTIVYQDALDEPDSVVLPTRTFLDKYLSYPNNWNEATATYIDENLTGIVNLILSLVDEDGGTIADMLDGVLDIYNDDTVNSLIASAQDLTSELDADLLKLVDVMLDLDLSSWNTYAEDQVWGVEDRESFVTALTVALAPLERLFNWLLCADDIAYFHGSDGETLITVTGTEGYAYGLVPILEALGVEGLLPASEFKTADFATKIETLLGSVLERVDGILANPIDEILALIPNLIYFLNADGLTISIKNLLGGIYNIIEDVEPITGPIDIDEELGFPLSDLSLMNLLAIAEEELEFSLDPLTKDIDKFYFGEISHYISANGDTAFRMDYSATEGRKDLITIVFSLLLQVLDYDENAEAFQEMLGVEVYAALKNVLHLGEFSLEMLDIEWINTELAGTDEVINSLETSELFEFDYGQMWTKERAKYVDENINQVVDNIIYLLGVRINDIRVEGLDDLLLALLGTSLYTQDNVVSILEAIQDLVAEIDEIDPDGHIKAIINNSLGIDLSTWDDMDENTFNVPDNDKDAFIDAITQILAPLNPILGWLLCDDDIAFFVDEDGEDYIYLGGAEGYEYGIIPILEILECEDILKPEDFNADRDNMLRNILLPLLSKVDEILMDPVNGILDIMPALTYFINSNGLDVAFKNLINPIRVVLSAIEPVQKVELDLYEILGFDVENFDFETMILEVLDDLYESTGYDLTPLVMDALAEMTLGRVVEKDSVSAMNNYKRYTMEYAGPDRADMITILGRLVIQFITLDENAEKIKAMIRENVDMDEASYGYVSSLIDMFASTIKEEQGMDTILGVIYYIVFGLDIGTTEMRDLYDTLNDAWAAAFEALRSSHELEEFYNDAARFLEKYFPDIISPGGILAPNGFMAFFQRIAEFFEKIKNWFSNLFGG